METTTEALDQVMPKDKDSRGLWVIVARTLAKAFEHDQDGTCRIFRPLMFVTMSNPPR